MKSRYQIRRGFFLDGRPAWAIWEYKDSVLYEVHGAFQQQKEAYSRLLELRRDEKRVLMRREVKP